MGMFRAVATEQLKLLFVVFLLGNASRLTPPDPARANACGTDLYRSAFLAHHSFLLTAFTAFMLLLTLRADLRLADALDANQYQYHELRIGSVVPWWWRLWLRGTLLAAVAISFAASVLAVVAFEDGLLYRTGCRAAGYGAGSRSVPAVLLMGLFALVHGFFAWAAVTQD